MADTPGEEVAQIQGDPHFPVNNGQLCIKGWTSFALLNHPGRLLSPLVRDARGGELRAATWDEALDRIADAMRRTKAEHGADANGVFGSGALTNEKAYLLGKFARLALGTANIDYNGRWCMSSAAGGSNRAFGIDRGLPFPVEDIAGAEVVVLVGSNCADTLPPIVQWFEKQKANGGRLAVVDPRRDPKTPRPADPRHLRQCRAAQAPPRRQQRQRLEHIGLARAIVARQQDEAGPHVEHGVRIRPEIGQAKAGDRHLMRASASPRGGKRWKHCAPATFTSQPSATARPSCA